MAKLVSEHSNVALADAHMLVLSTSILVSRYSIYSAAELRILLELSGDDDAVYDALDLHLRALTRAMFREYATASKR